MPEEAKTIRLALQGLAAFDVYISEAELAMQPALTGAAPFLWSDLKPEFSKRIHDGHVPAQFWSSAGTVHVPDGLIHDWIGSAFVPGVTVGDVLALVQNYNHHKDIYKPEVIDSRLLSHSGNDFQIHLRLLKKKIITVILDTYHDVHYSEISPTRWTCRSCTPRILEVEHAGTPKETIMAPDTGHGFLWRLNSYWKFEERDAGVWLECRAISLSRDIPKGLAWVIEPIIRKLPRESLIHTLKATRQALVGDKPLTSSSAQPPL
jgi:hypothetical protein